MSCINTEKLIKRYCLLKIALLSDIHGNLPALEIAVKKSGDVDGYVVLGDVVNYGPWSNECVQMLETLPYCTKIRGNHEDYYINGYLRLYLLYSNIDNYEFYVFVYH